MKRLAKQSIYMAILFIPIISMTGMTQATQFFYLDNFGSFGVPHAITSGGTAISYWHDSVDRVYLKVKTTDSDAWAEASIVIISIIDDVPDGDYTVEVVYELVGEMQDQSDSYNYFSVRGKQGLIEPWNIFSEYENRDKEFDKVYTKTIGTYSLVSTVEYYFFVEFYCFCEGDKAQVDFSGEDYIEMHYLIFTKV